MYRNLLLAVASVALLGVLLEIVFGRIEGHPAWEIPLPDKPLGVYRIAVLGGSTAQGTPVPELGFAALLDASLNQLHRSRRIEVLNLGQEGSPSAFVGRVFDHVVATGDADLLIVLTAHNEFLNRVGEANPLASAARDVISRFATTRVLVRRLARGDRRRTMPARLHPVDRSGDWFRDRLAAHRAHLTAMLESARRNRVPLLLLTAPSNLADWAPVHRDLAWSKPDPDYDAHVERAEELLAGGRLEAADRLLSELDSRFADDAMFVFLRGRLAHRHGRAGEARALLLRAKDLDPYPWRALSRQNDFIRELAESGAGVHLVDAERSLGDRAGSELVGFDWISDNVHPTPRGNAVIAAEIVRVMQGAGLLFGPARTPVPEPDVLLARVLADLPESRRGALEHQRLLRSGIYCMKTPFYHYAAARRYLSAAQKLAPRHWVAWANLGVLSLLEGDAATGRRLLGRAEALKGSPLDPTDRIRLPYLQKAIELEAKRGRQRSD